MKIDIDKVFDKIINIQADALDGRMLKDIALDWENADEYEISQSYVEAYRYLCDCLLICNGDNNSQKLLDLFMVHQYLCRCYLSRDRIDSFMEETDDLEVVMEIVGECFFIYRVVGAFQAAIEQYEILKDSNLWKLFDAAEKMQIMKEAAKSYRNTGDFYQALNLYFECLKLNSEQDWLQRVELLLKIGKVYRNYLMQIELARFYVEEAYMILKENGTQELSEKGEKRYAVICFDTLGQIYRDKREYEKAEEYFQKSKEVYGKKDGRARIHEILMKYQKDCTAVTPDLKKDIEFLTETIENLEKNPMDEIGVGVRSVQLGRIKFKDASIEREEAYKEVYRGREVANRYNDIKTVIRSYMEEAAFLKQEKKYEDYIDVSMIAVKIASDRNQLVLENEIIKEIIELSNKMPDMIDSTTKIELIKRRKDIYVKLVGFSKLSINIVREGMSVFFSKDKLIDMYGIVLGDFEQILGELNKIIEILNFEVERINQKYIAYLNTEIKGFTYKSILHKFKNDLPDETTINRLQRLCDNVRTEHPENRSILTEVNKQLETFANIIMHIKQSANDTLKESEYEKKWCLLDSLIRKGIQNFVCYKPLYEKVIQYSPAEQRIGILTQSTLFETTVSEILNNAFDYAESVKEEAEIEKIFRFFITLEVMEKRAVVLECYSRYWDQEAARIAADSIKNGLERRQSTKKNGSRYGFNSIKLLFEDLMGGEIQIIQREKEVGIRIRLPINLVTLRIEEGGSAYEACKR